MFAEGNGDVCGFLRVEFSWVLQAREYDE